MSVHRARRRDLPIRRSPRCGARCSCPSRSRLSPRWVRRDPRRTGWRAACWRRKATLETTRALKQCAPTVSSFAGGTRGTATWRLDAVRTDPASRRAAGAGPAAVGCRRCVRPAIARSAGCDASPAPRRAGTAQRPAARAAVPRVERIARGAPNAPYEVGANYAPERGDLALFQTASRPGWQPFHCRPGSGEYYDMHAMTAGTRRAAAELAGAHPANAEVIVRVNAAAVSRPHHRPELRRRRQLRSPAPGVGGTRLRHDDIRSGAESVGGARPGFATVGAGPLAQSMSVCMTSLALIPRSAPIHVCSFLRPKYLLAPASRRRAARSTPNSCARWQPCHREIARAAVRGAAIDTDGSPSHLLPHRFSSSSGGVKPRYRPTVVKTPTERVASPPVLSHGHVRHANDIQLADFDT